VGAPSEELFIAFLKNSRYVDSWSSLFPAAYVVKSRAEFHDLRRSMTDFLGVYPHFVARVDPDETGGRLPSALWDWINTEVFPQDLVEEGRRIRAEAAAQELDIK